MRLDASGLRLRIVALVVYLLDHRGVRLRGRLAGHGDGVGPSRANVVQRTLLLSILTLWHALLVEQDVLVLLVHGAARPSTVRILILLVTFLRVLGCHWILRVALRRHIARQLQRCRSNLRRLLLTLKCHQIL